MSSTPIPITSVFPTMPAFPSIRNIPIDLKPVVRRPPPILNKIYFNKKTLKETVQRYNATKNNVEIVHFWDIPFSVDVETPVTELTQRIHKVMTNKKIYKNWDINFNTFTIIAIQVDEIL
jgi:hypothetical protein